MKYEQWINEPFFRNLDENKKILELSKVVHDYLDYRNIEQSSEQKKTIIEFILEDLKKFSFAKTSLIVWAIHKFADPKNNNISAALFYSAIEIGYKSELYKKFIKLYQKEIEQNAISQESEASIEERKRIARKESFDKICQIVNSGKTDYVHVLWLNCMNYIGKDLKYAPAPEVIARFNELAINYITKDLKVIQADDKTSRDERTKAFTFLAEIFSNEIEQPELKSMIKLQRRKMICEDYIFNN